MIKSIAVDIGNTRIKAGVFEGGRLVQKFLLHHIDELGQLLSGPHDHVIVSSVREDADRALLFSSARGKKIKLTSQTPLPIQLNYSTPHTLGMDRIAAACGALQLFPAENCLAIDMGTCINYELLDQEGNYWGGIISPGVDMRFEAMHTLTARLPLLNAAPAPELIGDSTMGCMQSGVMNGILEEMKGIIERLKLKYPNLRVILCGGDAPLFENQLKPSIFAAPDLVLLGLNRILIHNATT
jgi:type III pantothenate kinase